MSNFIESKLFLKSYLKAKSELDILENQICELKEILGISGIAYDDVKVQQSKYPDEIVNKISILADLHYQVIASRNIAAAKLKEVTAVINQVDDMPQRKLLFHRYIKCLDWRDVAEQMRHSYDHTLKVHRNALKKIEQILKNNGLEDSK